MKNPYACDALTFSLFLLLCVVEVPGHLGDLADTATKTESLVRYGKLEARESMADHVHVQELLHSSS